MTAIEKGSQQESDCWRATANRLPCEISQHDADQLRAAGLIKGQLKKLADCWTYTDEVVFVQKYGLNSQCFFAIIEDDGNEAYYLIN
jgi:uncharacterized protein YlaN (UPF0358 family)